MLTAQELPSLMLTERVQNSGKSWSVRHCILCDTLVYACDDMGNTYLNAKDLRVGLRAVHTSRTVWPSRCQSYLPVAQLLIMPWGDSARCPEW